MIDLGIFKNLVALIERKKEALDVISWEKCFSWSCIRKVKLLDNRFKISLLSCIRKNSSGQNRFMEMLLLSCIRKIKPLDNEIKILSIYYWVALEKQLCT